MASRAVKRSNSGMAMSMSRTPVGSGREPRAVGGGVDAQAPAESAAHGLNGAEAAARRHGLDAEVAGLELAPGALDARGVDVGGRGQAGLGAEGAREVALAHVHARGERRDGELLVEVLDDPGLQLAQWLATRGLAGERGAELRLAARPAHVEDEAARGGQRGGRAVVLLDERERKVHAGRDARARG